MINGQHEDCNGCRFRVCLERAECRRFPPQVYGDMYRAQTRFPTAQGRCGEYRPLDPTPPSNSP